MFIQFGLTLWEVGVSEGGMEGLDEMGFQVPMGHNDKGEWLEQQALWSKEWWSGLHEVPVQMSQELSWCMQGGLVEANYPCMPGDPDYLRYQSRVQGYSDVYGVEYQPHSGPLSAIHEHNCSLCYVLCFNEGGSHNDPS